MKQAYRIVTVWAWLLMAALQGMAQNDSLPHYIRMAAEANPMVKSAFLNYKASLERIPQAGALADPQLQIGFFIEPMELVDGKQYAQAQLMQMFPWFGTRKAARSEATEMARMEYELFREQKDNVVMQVKVAWYQLLQLHQQKANISENRALLVSLKELSLSRFASTPFRASPALGGAAAPKPAVPAAATPPAGGMAGMGGGQAAMAPQPMQGPSMGGMTGAGGMGGGTASGMADVLRIELELEELTNQEETVGAEIRSAEARMNALLNRSAEVAIAVPDSITKVPFLLDEASMREAMIRQNPMLAMTSAEIAANKAKEVMNKRMGMPMLGVGLQYMLNGKSGGMSSMSSSMGGMDMIMPMVSVSIPLFRKKYSAMQREARFMQAAAQEKQQGAMNALAAEFSTAKQQLLTAERKVALYEKQKALAETAYQLAVSELAAGTGSMTAVLDVQRQLLDYKFNRAEAIATYNAIVANIEKLLSEPQPE